MEKIILKFSVSHCFNPLNSVDVTLTLDDNGKNYSVEYQSLLKEIKREMDDSQEENFVLPKRVLKAFTEHAVDRILSKDVIPNESGMMVLDGFSYEISITKGNVTKEYSADDANIETYPLLRYLASWGRNL